MYNNSYGNGYYNTYSQNINDRIDNQIAQLQQMKEQMKNQQPAINQTFQLAPQHSGIRYVNTIDDVKKEIIYGDTPFFSKDLTVLWIKNIKGEIKAYELNEIVEKDAKDMQIDYLQAQIEELKGMIKNDANVTNATSKQDTTSSTTDDDTNGTTIEKVEPSSISKVSTSKKK
jgi:hypothetical protein